MDEIRRVFWVLEHVNNREFIGRFEGRWTRAHSLDGAARFDSASDADNALQALLQEATDRLAKSQEHWPAQMWWDFKGGLVRVRQVEQITRLVAERAQPEPESVF